MKQTSRPATDTPAAPNGVSRSPKPLRVMIAGGGGLIGAHLAGALLARGEEVLVLSRRPRRVRQLLPGVAVLSWGLGQQSERWREELEFCDALVDLSGPSFFTPLIGEQYRRGVLEARRAVTSSLLAAIAGARRRPRAFLSASSLAAYGFRHADQALTERSAPDNAPLSRATVELEKLAARAENEGTRVVSLRIATVLAPEGGLLCKLAHGFGTGAPAPILPATQWFSWIHVEDAAGIALAALQDERMRGPVNVSSPEPVTNLALTKALCRAQGVKQGAPIDAAQLARTLGKPALALTQGQRVLPVAAHEHGYAFTHATLDGTVQEILSSPDERSARSPVPAISRRR